ncbi:MAG: hypothetical protein IT368_05840 [Candidatus Hydrogenedentes bacterium]|nr:hypothetical protein [Candidatus Hydrogenedentota bacterium]
MEGGKFVTLGVLLAAMAGAIVACTGIGGFTYQFFDYSFYDGFTRSLMESTWPLAFQEAGEVRQPMVPIYYFAYYLPSALVGKIFGWEVAYHFYFFWATAGLFLTLVWFLRIVGKRSLWLAALLLFFGGLDLVGQIFTAAPPGASAGSWFDYLTGTYWWSTGRGWMDHWMANYSLSGGKEIMNGVFYKFYGPMSFLVDGPYHFIPTAIGLMMIFHDTLRRRTNARVGFLWTSLPIGSVIVAIGAAPFVLLPVIRDRFRGAFTMANLVAGLPLLAIFLLYYGTIDGEAVSGPLWKYQRISNTWPLLVLFYAAEFGIYTALYFCIRKDGRAVPNSWIYAAVAVFVIAPWYRLGVYNDFTVKAVIPAQILFVIAMAIALTSERETRRGRKGALIALICLGTLASAGIIVRAVEFGFRWHAPPLESVRRVNEVLPLDLTLQGRADTDAFFWRYLARTPQLTPPLEVPVAREWDFVNHPEALEGWDLYGRDHELTAQGLMIYTDGKNALMRLRNVDLDAERIGTCVVDIRVEDYDHHQLPHQIVLVWANAGQADTGEAPWPFKRFRASVVEPLERSLGTNPYWRGRVGDIALYLEMAEPLGCRVYVKAIRFLTR